MGKVPSLFSIYVLKFTVLYYLLPVQRLYRALTCHTLKISFRYIFGVPELMNDRIKLILDTHFNLRAIFQPVTFPLPH